MCRQTYALLRFDRIRPESCISFRQGSCYVVPTISSRIARARLPGLLVLPYATAVLSVRHLVLRLVIEVDQLDD